MESVSKFEEVTEESKQKHAETVSALGKEQNLL